MSVASKPTPSSTLPSPFLMGLTSLEQLHSSVVIEKDTSSMTLFDSILPGALESVSAGEPPAPARGRGARGGRMRRAGGARGRGAAPLFRYCTFWKTMMFVILPEDWKHPQIPLSVVTFLRAGNRKQ